MRLLNKYRSAAGCTDAGYSARAMGRVRGRGRAMTRARARASGRGRVMDAQATRTSAPIDMDEYHDSRCKSAI